MANSKEIQSSRERLSRRVNVTYQFGKGTSFQFMNISSTSEFYWNRSWPFTTMNNGLFYV